MNLNIPKSRMGFEDIDYNRIGENYGMIIESVLYEGTTISLLLPLEMHNNIV